MSGPTRVPSPEKGTSTPWIRLALGVGDSVTLLVSGTEAHATIHQGKLFYQCKKVPGADGNQPFTALPAAPPAPLHQFLNAVAGQKDMPLVTPREAVLRVSVMEAMYEGFRKQTWVKPA